MEINIDNLLSARIKKHCLLVYNDGHYKHAAHEAMIQVELALKEKGLVKDGKYGQDLINHLFSTKTQYVKLRVPLGEDLQRQAGEFFKGVFSYYRNYLAHDGSSIDKSACIKVMLIASELLNLIDASSLSFADLGGSEGLVESKVFNNKKDILNLLKLLDNYTLPDGDADGLREEMLDMGLIDTQLDAILDLDLVRYEENEYIPTQDELMVSSYHPSTIGNFTLTDLGRQFIEAIETGESK